MRGSRITRVLLWTLLALVVVLVATVTVERLRGSTALRRWRQAMRARGERLDLAELARPVPPGKTGLSANQIESLLRWSELRGLDVGVDDWRQECVRPGRMVVVWQAAAADHVPWGTNTWEDCAARAAPALGLARHVLATMRQRDWVYAPDYSAGASMKVMEVFGFINAARAFSQATLVALRAHRADDACDLLLAGLILPRAGEEDGSLIGCIGRLAAGSIMFPPTWQALQSADWTEPRLAELQAAWAHWRFLEDLVWGLELERAFWSTALYDLARRDLPAALRVLDLSGSSAGVGPSDSAGLQVLSEAIPGFEGCWALMGQARVLAGACVWRVAWLDTDQEFYCRAMQEGIDAARRKLAGGPQAGAAAPPSARTNALLVDQLIRLGGLDAARLAASRRITPRCVSAILEAIRLEALRELTVTAIALKRYRLRHGRWPADLTGLVPDFLPKPPLDIHSGEPLRYRLAEDGSFVLYSVGEDGRDDGGDPESDRPAPESGWPCAGKDWVWPQPMTPADGASAPSRKD